MTAQGFGSPTPCPPHRGSDWIAEVPEEDGATRKGVLKNKSDAKGTKEIMNDDTGARESTSEDQDSDNDDSNREIPTKDHNEGSSREIPTKDHDDGSNREITTKDHDDGSNRDVAKQQGKDKGKGKATKPANEKSKKVAPTKKRETKDKDGEGKDKDGDAKDDNGKAKKAPDKSTAKTGKRKMDDASVKPEAAKAKATDKGRTAPKVVAEPGGDDKVEGTAPAKQEPPAAGDGRKIDIWWSDEIGKALLRVTGGGVNIVEMSTSLVAGEDGFVYALFNGYDRWRVPHLVKDDLEKFQAAAVPLPRAQAPEKPPAKKARKKGADKPVEDYELQNIIRCRYATQGEKNPPIVKVELREDRFDTSSKWRQRFQIVIRDHITAVYAMNVAKTFSQCYVHMNCNQNMLDYKECRNALLEYKEDGKLFDWEKKPLDWKRVNSMMLKAYPPACLGSGWVFRRACAVDGHCFGACPG